MKISTKILVVFGTRPEAIKLAPVVDLLKSDNRFDIKVCITAQHREMLDQVLSLFNISPDYDLNIMSTAQSLPDISRSILEKLTPVIKEFEPNLLLVHGDTSTTFAASLAAFYEKTDVAHVEAGLRTGDNYNPWPEEVNRKMTGIIAKYHFAPTEISVKNLIAENYCKDNIFLTGNTVIDTLFLTVKKIKNDRNLQNIFKKQFSFIDENRKMILVTSHRRENISRGLEQICYALLELAKKHNNIQIVYPVHPNPKVRKIVFKLLSHVKNIELIEPQQYLAFVFLMTKSYIILTDSGGIQEEAPSLGIPVLVMRNITERPEAVDAGTVRLVGTNKDAIISNVSELLNNKKIYDSMRYLHNPYGDGHASKRIFDILVEDYVTNRLVN